MTNPDVSSTPRTREVLVNLLCATRDLTEPFEDFFQEHGITRQQYNVLRILYEQGRTEGLSCSRIQERILHCVPDITRLVDRMEEAGLVQRRRSSEDRRIVLVQPTEAGLRLCEQLEEPLTDLSGQTLAHMNPEEIDRLNQLLEKLRAPFKDTDLCSS